MSRLFQKKKNYLDEAAPRGQRRKLDIMLEAALPASFSPQLWEKISWIPSGDFIRNQEDIKNILLSDEKLFQSFFLKFYANHQHLNNWYMLANSNQLQIKKYIFHNLLSKKFKQYRDMIRQFFAPAHSAKSYELFREEKNTIDKKKQSFHKITVGNNGDYSPKRERSEREYVVKSQLRESRQIGNEDYHDLFLRTFGACDGSKYIYYDFNRHMKGVEEQKKYNQFIRIKKHKGYQSHLGEFDPSIQKKQIDVDQAIKSVNMSFYTSPQNPFLHEGEQTLEDMKYCNVTLDPIGEIQKIKYVRELMWLRQTAKGMKKVKSQQTPFRFQLKRKKIL